MTEGSTTPEERYQAIVEALGGSPGVTRPSDAGGAKRFGASALRVNDKIFAMLVEGSLVVKVPRDRVEALIASGLGEPFDTGRGRIMKEWVSVPPTSGAEWLPLATEALEFVSSKR